MHINSFGPETFNQQTMSRHDALSQVTFVYNLFITGKEEVLL